LTSPQCLTFKSFRAKKEKNLCFTHHRIKNYISTPLMMIPAIYITLFPSKLWCRRSRRKKAEMSKIWKFLRIILFSFMMIHHSAPIKLILSKTSIRHTKKTIMSDIFLLLHMRKSLLLMRLPFKYSI